MSGSKENGDPKKKKLYRIDVKPNTMKKTVFVATIAFMLMMVPYHGNAEKVSFLITPPLLQLRQATPLS